MVALSSLGGAGWQFFDNNGDPLSGGKLYTYAAGTTTPAVTYTSNSGATPHANPIILDSAGRVPSEIWLTSSAFYKFRLDTSTDVTIWTKDNVPGILATADITASTVAFTGFKSQSGFVSDLADNDGADWIGFEPSGSGAVARSVQDKLRDEVWVQDFGAVGDGLADDTAAITAALNAASTINFGGPEYTYIVSSSSVADIILEITTPGSRTIIGQGATIKIKNGSLEYKAIMGSDDSTLDLGDFTVDGLVFDCNKANMTYAVAGNQLTNFCGGVKVRRARTVNITNNLVLGPVSRQFFFFPGVTTAGGVDAYSIDYVNVSDNTFLSVGKAGLAYFDSSLIYINCRMGVVNNNYGIGETMGVNGAVTFIEMHNQNMIVTGNYVDNYQSLAVISGITLVDTERSLVSGNVAHVYRNGIVMFATQYLSHTTGYGIRGILISDNYISVQQSACPAGLSLGYGIGFQSGSNLPNADISIKNNFVEYEIENSAQAYTFLPFGAIGATESATTSSFERLEISGNTIINSLCPAVQLGSNGGIFKDCYIGTNYIINPGQSQYAGMGTSSRSGVLIQAEELQGFLTIDKQFISDTFATTRMIYGMTFDVDTLSTSIPVTAAADIKITGSTTTAFVAPVRLNDTNSIPQFDVSLNMAPPTFGTRAWKAGSKLFDTVNNITYTNTADGTTFISTGYAAAAPVSGTHARGSIRYDTAPAAGGFIGWVCTAAGTPGTWKTFGAISV